MKNRYLFLSCTHKVNSSIFEFQPCIAKFGKLDWKDEIYWERRYTDEFGVMHARRYTDWTWKGRYLERYMAKRLEEAEPQYLDEENMGEITDLVAPYVCKLEITQQQPWKPPLYYEPDEIPDVWPIQHINFVPIFSKLPNLTEVDITYGLKNIWETYKPSMFKIAVSDIKHLGKAVLHLSHLKILRLRRCAVEDDHVQALVKHLVENTTLEELDLSHCLIKDRGAKCVAKLMTVHPTLKILRLTNNQIAAQGALGLGFALLHVNCCPLVTLDLRLNPLKHEGTMGILRATIRINNIKELNIAGVFFEDDTSLRLAQMLSINRSLKKVDCSSNYFTEEAAEAMINTLKTNKVIEWLDLRECYIEETALAKINKLLLRNRKGLDEEAEDAIVQAEEVELVEGERSIQWEGSECNSRVSVED